MTTSVSGGGGVGSKGDTGAKGDTGNTGPQGPAGTVPAFSGAKIVSAGLIVGSTEAFFTSASATYDTDSYMAVTSEDIFLVPFTGYYLMTFNVLSQNTIGSGEYQLLVYPGSDANVFVTGPCPIIHKTDVVAVYEGHLTVGDLVDVSFFQTSGVSQTCFLGATISLRSKT